MSDQKLVKILRDVIRVVHDVENCGADWRSDCEDILSRRCEMCCEGVKLLRELNEKTKPEAKGKLF